MLLEDMQIWVTERKPKSSREAGELAENYLQARAMTTPPKASKAEKMPMTKCPRCGLHGHWGHDCPQPRQKSDAPRPPRELRPRYLEGVRCFKCDEKEHLAANCLKKSLYCDQGIALPENQQSQGVHRRGTINRVYCTDILVDTGATKMLVQRELVSDEDILGGEITICCVHGDVVSFPLAAVKISLTGEDIIVQAGISSMLPASALLGWDIPQLMSLVSREGLSLERV